MKKAHKHYLLKRFTCCQCERRAKCGQAFKGGNVDGKCLPSGK